VIADHQSTTNDTQISSIERLLVRLNWLAFCGLVLGGFIAWQQWRQVRSSQEPTYSASVESIYSTEVLGLGLNFDAQWLGKEPVAFIPKSSDEVLVVYRNIPGFKEKSFDEIGNAIHQHSMAVSEAILREKK
jgi:hypothetical protein